MTPVLFAAGADLNQKDDESLVVHHEIFIENEDISMALLQHGADADRENLERFKVLHTANEFQDTRTVNALLGAGADVNAGGAAVPRALNVVCE